MFGDCNYGELVAQVLLEPLGYGASFRDNANFHQGGKPPSSVPDIIVQLYLEINCQGFVFALQKVVLLVLIR